MAKLNFASSDVVEWCKSYDGPKFHALLTDCPYEYGFMGKSWDSSGVSFKPETWDALAGHLYPGAFGMTYGGPRTWHRVAVAIEDAGLIIHPTIFAWLYSSGFPKASRIDTKLDKAAGVKREVVGYLQHPASEIFQGGKLDRRVEITAPASDLSAAWEGHRYGLQALKPAVEPIILFQKPYDDKAYESIAEYGAGAVWIEGTRIGDGDNRAPGGPGSEETRFLSPADPKRFARPSGGLWPANFVISHHQFCTNKSCYEDCNVLALKENSRFYTQTSMIAEALEHEAVIYSSKPSDKEKLVGTNGDVDHDTVKPISVNQHLATLLLPPDRYAPRRLLVPFAGVASEMIGGLLAGWEEIQGIELSTDYTKVGRKRAGWWDWVVSVHGNDINKILSFDSIKTSKAQTRMDL